MTKKQTVKKIDSLIKKRMAELVKDVNAILKSEKMWYCMDDLIKHHDDMHTPTDRNGDQLVIDYAIDTITGANNVVQTLDEHMLWTKEDFTA